MKYTKNLFEQHPSQLLKEPWYHQRFDGCPLLISYIGEAQARKETRKRDNHFTLQLSFFENERTDWYMYQPDIDRVTGNFIRLTTEKPDDCTRILSDWQEDEIRFYDKCIELKKTDLTQRTDQQLKHFFLDLNEIYLNRLTSSSLIDGFALGSDRIVAEMIQKKVGEQKLGGSFTEYFSALTAPVHLSFINDVEIEILQVAQKVQKKPGLKRAFLREDPDEISRELKKNPSIQHAIQSLQDKFFWSKNNYVHDNRLDTAHFIREIQEILRQHTDILGHIEKIKNTPIQNRKEKEKLFKKLEIDGTLKALIRLNEDFTYWQDERKKATYWGTHYLGVLLEEIGKRTGYTVDEIKYFTPSEVHHVFEKKDWHAELAARKKGCVIHWDETRFEVLSGAKYQKFKKDFRGHTDYAHLTELKGLTACLGKVQGTVKRVLSATEVGKVEKGDILVAVMTRPDYIVAMKKAAAIVTNEGGITSHAAIVSRELKIPCVIGTKIATNALHDGDLIEVDADNGIIRILKRASQ